MLKKALSTGLCLSLLLGSAAPAFAETINSTNTAQPSAYEYRLPDTNTLQSRLTLVEQAAYGQGQTGALMTRISNLENDFYGRTSSTNTALSDRINTLYSTMYDNSVRPSAITQMNGIEWFLSGHVSNKSITERITSLETEFYGKPSSGTLQKRMNALALSAYGNSDSKTPLVSTTIPADTLIKIKLVTPLNSDTTKTGDKVQFQAAEDIIYNGRLIIAAGSPGEGVVTKVKGAQNFGRNGELSVNFQQIQAFDGTTVPTVLGDKAKMEIKNLAMAAGASIAGMALLGPIGIVGGIFVQGKDADLPAGTELYIQTQSAANIYAIKTNLKDNFKVNTPEPNISAEEKNTDNASSDTNTNTKSNAADDNDAYSYSYSDSNSASTASTASTSAKNNTSAQSSASSSANSNSSSASAPSSNNIYQYEY